MRRLPLYERCWATIRSWERKLRVVSHRSVWSNSLIWGILPKFKPPRGSIRCYSNGWARASVKRGFSGALKSNAQAEGVGCTVHQVPAPRLEQAIVEQISVLAK